MNKYRRELKRQNEKEREREREQLLSFENIWQLLFCTFEIRTTPERLRPSEADAACHHLLLSELKTLRANNYYSLCNHITKNVLRNINILKEFEMEMKFSGTPYFNK